MEQQDLPCAAGVSHLQIPLGQQFFRLKGRFRGRIRALPLKILVWYYLEKLRHRIRTL